MKKLAAILLVIILVMSMIPAALAAQYEDANWLYADWELNGYPDDVGGVYSYDGDPTHLCILLVGDDGTREEEIRSSLNNSEHVRFSSAERPFKEFIALRDEVSAAYQNESHGVTVCKIVWNEKAGTFSVSVEINEEKLAETAKLLGEKYGDAVIVSGLENDDAETEGDAAPDEDGAEPKEPTRRDMVIQMVSYIAAMAATVAYVIWRRKKREKDRKQS